MISKMLGTCQSTLLLGFSMFQAMLCTVSVCTVAAMSLKMALAASTFSAAPGKRVGRSWKHGGKHFDLRGGGPPPKTPGAAMSLARLHVPHGGAK